MNTTTEKGLTPDGKYIKSLFGSIAQTYDKANDAMTFGMARSWRKKVVSYSQTTLGSDVLDCATGTGDLAIDFKRNVGPEGQVTGCDFCPEMLSFAPKKADDNKLNIKFESC